MKLPSINKQTIGTFFLHHTEKLILALCLALFGLFLWMGLKTEPFEKSDPSKLVSDVERADRHVKNPDVWEAIGPHRKGRTDVLTSIKKFEGNGALRASAYSIDTLSGVPALAKSPRTDPVLVAPQNPRAEYFRAPLLIAIRRSSGGNRNVPNDGYSELTAVGDPNFSSGGRSFGSGDGYDEGADFGDDFGDSYGDFGGRDTGPGARGRAKDDDEEEDALPTVEAGSQVQPVHVDTMIGINPRTLGVDAQNYRARLLDVVCVTATLDIQKQFKAFDTLTDSIGYFHERDKPVHQFVEVQRRINGGAWEDRSEFVQVTLPSNYPEMHQMPKSVNSSAPDNTGPQYFEPVLTGPIPSVAFVDYLKFIGHPDLPGTREFPDLEDGEVAEENPLDFGASTPGGVRQRPGRGVAGRGTPGGRPGFSGGRAGTQRGLGTRGTAGSAAGEEEILQSRAGADFTDYMKALIAERPEERFKLVRFFDVFPGPLKSRAKVEYRIRVWVGDPNNEDPEGWFVSLQAGGGGSGTRSGGGGGRNSFGGGDDAGYDDEGYDDGPSSPGRRTPAARGVGQRGTNGRLGPQKTEITSNMKGIDVRRRLKQATETERVSQEDPDALLYDYTVAELRQKTVKGPDGKETVTEEYETIPVPAGHEYLRFARPSAWSDLATVIVTPDNSQVAVGKIVTPKQVKLKVGGVDTFFPVGEPQMEIVASTWSAEYGTAIPTKQTVSRGELLNFNSAAHIVHPITWKVYLTKNPRAAQGEDRFKVPIRTGKVVVDALGGDELPLPRAEKMRHNLAGEILVMDRYGNLKISNDIADRTTYRNLLLEPDESQTVGRPRRPKKKKSVRGGDFGDDEYNDDF